MIKSQRPRIVVATVFAALLLTLPALAHAQALAGVVKDTSGAVLPGVTVSASSAALIERTRSTVTDGSGQYQIVDLRPGSYSVTFMLPGFATIERNGVEVTGGGVTRQVGRGQGVDIASPGAVPSEVAQWGEARIREAYASVGIR